MNDEIKGEICELKAAETYCPLVNALELLIDYQKRFAAVDDDLKKLILRTGDAIIAKHTTIGISKEQ